MNNQVMEFHPRGSVLMLTLFILLMLSLMGIALMSNTITEVQVSNNTVRGRDAFTKADSLNRIGILMGRALLHEGSGDVADLIKSRSETYTPPDRPPYNVSIDSSFTFVNAQSLARESTEEEIKERYLMATAANTPHLTMKYGLDVVGSAAVGLEKVRLNLPGASIGQDSYDTNDGTTIRVHIIVSSNGKVPVNAGAIGDYYSGDVDAAHSVVTSVFLETMP